MSVPLLVWSDWVFKFGVALIEYVGLVSVVESGFRRFGFTILIENVAALECFADLRRCLKQLSLELSPVYAHFYETNKILFNEYTIPFK